MINSQIHSLCANRGMVPLAKVLWISRHGSLPKQTKALEQLLGSSIQYKTLENERLQIGTILKVISDFKPTEVIANLPIHLLEQLTKNGIYPLVSVLENTNDLDNCDVIYDGYKGRNFLEFKRIVSVEDFYFPSLEKKFIVNPSLGFQPTSDRILLFSYKRSSISDKEKIFLEDLYGKKLTYSSIGKNTDVAILAKKIKNSEFLDVIVEAPRSVLLKLSDLNVCPLIIETEKSVSDIQFDIEYSEGQKLDFIKCKRLQRLYVEYKSPSRSNLLGKSITKNTHLSKLRTLN